MVLCPSDQQGGANVFSFLDLGVGGRGVGGLRMSLSLVSHISDKPILVISVIGHNLDTTVRELHSVLSYKSL